MNSQLVALATFVFGVVVGGGGVAAWTSMGSAPESEPMAEAAGESAGGPATAAPMAPAPPGAQSIDAVLETDADGQSLIFGQEVVEGDADFAEVLAMAKARGAAMTVCAKQGSEADVEDFAIVTTEGGEAAAQATATYTCAPIAINVTNAPHAEGGEAAPDLSKVDGGL